MIVWIKHNERFELFYVMYELTCILENLFYVILVSYLSAISVLGFVGEMYLYGTLYLNNIPGFFMGTLLSIHCIMPILHKSKITSVNEYLVQRFHYWPLVKIVSLITILQVKYFLTKVHFKNISAHI